MIPADENAAVLAEGPLAARPGPQQERFRRIIGERLIRREGRVRDAIVNARVRAPIEVPEEKPESRLAIPGRHVVSHPQHRGARHEQLVRS